MMDTLRALSVNNPWGWALCANLPDGKPFKSGENRTSRLGAPNVSKIVLIQVGLKKPNPAIVEEGSVRPLLFKVPHDVDAKARWMLASMRKGLVLP